MGCNDCKKYTVSCSVLEGFECCKCCRIGECKYDICPPEEKLPISVTEYEFFYISDVNYIFNSLNISKDAFLDKRFDKYYFHQFEWAENEFRELKNKIPNNNKLRRHIKVRLLKDVKQGLSSCKDLRNLILNALGREKKKGNFKYFKRNLNKFSKETIGKIKRLSQDERYKLLKLKGVANPLPYIR